MWTNDARTTGTNSIPMGKKRQLPGLINTGEDKAPSSVEIENGSVKTAPRSVTETPNDATFTNTDQPDKDAVPRGRQKQRRNTGENNPRSRWGSQSIRSTLNVDSLPTSIPGFMSLEDTDMYALKIRIEEITQKLSTNTVVPNDKRSLSPDPVYDMTGRRINVREARYRERLEAERHDLVAKAFQLNPLYKPPSHYRRPVTKHEKVYVPVDDYPEINFIGLIIGPRGNTLKRIERDSGAKVAIRGKGSIKEGKGRGDLALAPDQDENLHCLIISSNPASALKAREMINEIIETAASTPENMNALKRNQLRELATLNGTLRDDESKTCSNCGEVGHRRYDCPKEINYTARIICRVCGNGGHFGRDCLDRPRGQDWKEKSSNPNPRDQEYDEFIRDVLGGPKSSSERTTIPPNGSNLQQVGNNTLGRDLVPRPWEHSSSAAQAPWAQVGGTLAKPSELRSIDTLPPWREPSSSFIKPHEIRENPIPKDHLALRAQPRPWSHAGRNANESPGGMNQFQNDGNENPRNPLSSSGLPENIGSRERDIGAEIQSRASGDLSPQEYPHEYDRFREAQGYDGDRRLAHNNPHGFQNHISPKSHAAVQGGPQPRLAQRIPDGYHSHHPQAYHPPPGHPGFHQTTMERPDNGLCPWSHPPPSTSPLTHLQVVLTPLNGSSSLRDPRAADIVSRR
ncbi:hypothetical protein C7212DRAFT_357811 [Tuber magnatum]|uniref:Branchpoint-bridging protein n=1 Tax=Tuber magnatum TaxID=42249 RepID=A0A317SMK4_9PEZI|nr:hypothetical protein C7212DRAFT_357811 [Tuber magnatum]